MQVKFFKRQERQKDEMDEDLGEVIAFKKASGDEKR